MLILLHFFIYILIQLEFPHLIHLISSSVFTYSLNSFILSFIDFTSTDKGNFEMRHVLQKEMKNIVFLHMSRGRYTALFKELPFVLFLFFLLNFMSLQVLNFYSMHQITPAVLFDAHLKEMFQLLKKLSVYECLQFPILTTSTSGVRRTGSSRAVLPQRQNKGYFIPSCARRIVHTSTWDTRICVFLVLSVTIHLDPSS